MGLQLCCVRAGSIFPPEYVAILHDSVRRNLAEGTEGTFTCFTDQDDELPSGVVKRPLPVEGLTGWWNKVSLFKDGVFPEGDRVLYFDLACLITGPIDALAKYDGPFALLRDFYRPRGMQSSVMAWTAGECAYMWNAYEQSGCPQDFTANGTWGDQAWIEAHSDQATGLQITFPGMFASYKADQLEKNPPSKASVVIFHGEPKPHQITTGWVPQVWKIGGITRAELDAVCNTETAKLEANVKSAIMRDLPWFDLSPASDGHVVIIGGGPSLKYNLDEIKWRQSIGQKVWALNNVAQYLKNNQIFPDCVILADARPENAGFFDGADPIVTYFIASQCDPAVFETLDHLHVVLWHCNTPGIEKILKGIVEKPVHLFGGGSTVGLNAMTLAFGAGYRKIHLYGFDSSYTDGKHHAYEQKLNDGERVVDALCAGKTFKCAPWMVQQATEFERLATELIQDGCIITVTGDGLLPTLAREMMANPAVTPAEARAGEVLKRIAEIEKPKGVEVGVFTGKMSKALLEGHPGLFLHMVDSWKGNGESYQGDSGDWHAGLSQEAQEGFRQQAYTNTDFAKDRRGVWTTDSVTAADWIEPEQDFVFIDADHSYEGCKRDIEHWKLRVKSGGWLCGHDYENKDFPKFGVTDAVNEFAAAHGFNIELGENFTWFIQL